MNGYYTTRLMHGLMKLILSGLLLVLPGLHLQAQEQQEEVNYSDPQTWLLGYFDYDSFLDEPHDAWFGREFSNYSFDDKSFLELEQKGIDDAVIIVVLGTWCPDSRREVPRFMKITESLGYDPDKIKFIGVDSYKEAPVDDYDSLNIEKVPTFIFYDDKHELGRIIEYPETSLEKDMLNIFSRR